MTFLDTIAAIAAEQSDLNCFDGSLSNTMSYSDMYDYLIDIGSHEHDIQNALAAGRTMENLYHEALEDGFEPFLVALYA